jgi:Aspartyl protease
MGEVRTEFELVNSVDDELCLRGTLAANAVRRCTVAMLVDTGAVEVFLPEDLVLQLGLRVRNNATETFQLAGPLTVRFGNSRLSRQTTRV